MPLSSREGQGPPGGLGRTGLGSGIRLPLQGPGDRLGQLAFSVWDAVRREGWAGKEGLGSPRPQFSLPPLSPLFLCSPGWL